MGAWDGGAVTLYWMSHWWLLRALRGLASSATTESLPAARAAVHRLQLACQCSLPRDESGLSAAARSLCVVAPTTAQRVSTHAFWLVAGLADGRAVLMDGEVYTSLDVSGSALKLSGVDAAAAQVRCSLSQARICVVRGLSLGAELANPVGRREQAACCTVDDGNVRVSPMSLDADATRNALGYLPCEGASSTPPQHYPAVLAAGTRRHVLLVPAARETGAVHSRVCVVPMALEEPVVALLPCMTSVCAV